MDVLSQLLLCLVFVLSLALYFRVGQAPTTAPSLNGTTPRVASSDKAKSKTKKKAKKTAAVSQKEQPAQDVPSKQSQSSSTSAPIKAGQRDQATGSSAVTTTSSSSADGRTGTDVASTSTAASVKDVNDAIRAGPGNSDASAQLAPEVSEVAPAQQGSFSPGDYQDSDEESQATAEPEAEVWQSVGGKGSAKATGRESGRKGEAAYSSVASANPFSVLPSTADGPKRPAGAARSLSIPSSSGKAGPSSSATKKATPTTSSYTSSAASSAEQTKRQRQNAARQQAAKAAKDAEEQQRQARLEAHRREAQRERLKEEERKKSASKVNKGNAKANGQGGQPKASVNLQGQLVWD